MPRFSGKVAIITGSSNGIGRTTAILFARDGARVTITGRDAEALKITKSECFKAGAKEEDIVEVLGDITKEEVQDELIKKTIDKFGKLDILVNNHGGGLIEVDSEGKIDISGFEAIFDLNCKSSLSLTLKAVPYLQTTKGEVVNVSSNVSSTVADMVPLYAMAKAAMDHMTRILAYKYARDGIRVNTVNPGLVRTTFLSKLGISEELQREFEQMYLDEDTIPLGRIGTTTDIAEPIAFLADRHASGFMTGQTIVIDGGATLQHAGLAVKGGKRIAEKLKAAQKL